MNFLIAYIFSKNFTFVIIPHLFTMTSALPYIVLRIVFPFFIHTCVFRWVYKHVFHISIKRIDHILCNVGYFVQFIFKF